MGCDIHIFTEVKEQGKWKMSLEDVFSLDDFERTYYKKDKTNNPFDDRHYGVFAFLAGVRNYSDIKGFECKYALPEDITDEVKQEYEDWAGDAHSISYLYAKELIEFDYDQICNDKRVTRQIAPNIFHGGMTGTEEEGTKMPFKEYLGVWFMKHVEELKVLVEKYEDVRVVFWFDN